MTATSLDPTWSIPLGTPVDDIDGHRVGKVCGADNASLRVERGLILRQEWAVDFHDVDRVEDGRVILSVTKEQVMRR